MMSRVAWFALLAFFSGLSLNLILQCGLGMAGIVGFQGQGRRFPLIKTGLAFVVIVLLWVLFTRILPLFTMGFFGYMVLFPSAALFYSGFEYLVFVLILKRDAACEEGAFFYDGLVGAALFIAVSLSNSFAQTLALAFGFASSILLTLLILGEIHRRSEMEAVPRFLRGEALTLISMGLLSLISGSAAVMFFRALGA